MFTQPTQEDVKEFRQFLLRTTGLQLGSLPEGCPLSRENFIILMHNALDGEFAKLQTKLQGERKRPEYAGMPPDFPRGYPGGPQHMK